MVRPNEKDEDEDNDDIAFDVEDNDDYEYDSDDNQSGVTRESLNKFAGARAVMYFQGNWSSVKFDDVKSLARNGTDILFIEKMGIVDLPITMAIPYLCLPCCFHFLRCSCCFHFLRCSCCFHFLRCDFKMKDNAKHNLSDE